MNGRMVAQESGILSAKEGKIIRIKQIKCIGIDCCLHSKAMNRPSGSGSFEILTLGLTLGNGSGTDFHRRDSNSSTD